jgi:hypothetical protein
MVHFRPPLAKKIVSPVRSRRSGKRQPVSRVRHGRTHTVVELSNRVLLDDARAKSVEIENSEQQRV